MGNILSKSPRLFQLLLNMASSITLILVLPDESTKWTDNLATL